MAKGAGGMAEQSEQALHREGPSWSHIWTFPKEPNRAERLMKVLSYVIELFHVHQTLMLAWSAAQDVRENPMDVCVPHKGPANSTQSRAHVATVMSENRLLTQNLDAPELWARTWTHSSGRLGLWGMTNRVWHSPLLKGPRLDGLARVVSP